MISVPKFIAMIVIHSITPGAAAKLELVFNKLGCGAMNLDVNLLGPML